jgi:hypothetical protein
MKHLAAPIAARRTVKLEEMELLLGKTMSRALFTVQKIDAVIIFLLSSIDFLLLNGEVGGIELRLMDKKIRRMMNRELKIKRLPIECHHTSWGNGRLSHLSLRDRGDVFTIRPFV